MVLSFVEPKNSEWTNYYVLKMMIKDLKRGVTPSAVRLHHIETPICMQDIVMLGDLLAANTSLKWLSVPVCPEIVFAVVQALDCNTTLVGLITVDHGFGSHKEEAKWIADGIASNCSSKTIDPGVSESGPWLPWHWEDLLRESQTLESLHMRHSFMLEVSAIGIADGIASKCSLKTIDLGDCGVGAAGAVVLGRALGESLTLESLRLRHNRIGDEGAIGVADGIARSCSLKIIDLGDCGIGAVGAVVLGRAVGESKTLESFCIYENRIGDEGVIGVADGIARSCSLTAIDLDNCCIGVEGAMALGCALGESQTLVSLRMQQSQSHPGSAFGNEGTRSIALGIANSKSLKEMAAKPFTYHRQDWLIILLAIKQSVNCDSFSIRSLFIDAVGSMWQDLDLPRKAEGWSYAQLFRHWANEKSPKPKFL